MRKLYFPETLIHVISPVFVIGLLVVTLTDAADRADYTALLPGNNGNRN